MGKRGRKKKILTPLEEKTLLEDSLYARYEKSYEKARERYGYNLGEKLDKRNFLEHYGTEITLGSKRPIYNVVLGQRVISKKQAKAISRQLNKKKKKWDKMDFNSLSRTEQDLYNLIKEKLGILSFKDFYYLNGLGTSIYQYLVENDAWEVGLGS